MSYNLGTEENPILVLVNLSGGMLDAVVRATDEATFDAAARWADLKYEVTETVTDPETGETTTQGTGEWATAKGVHIDHLGPVVITPGTYGEDGTELTAPVVDTRHHVNIRLTDPALSRVDEYGVIKWEKWAMAWSLGGEDDTQINAQEVGKIIQGVSLIDLDTIASPSRVFL
jgi:hypothetical protein